MRGSELRYAFLPGTEMTGLYKRKGAKLRTASVYLNFLLACKGSGVGGRGGEREEEGGGRDQEKSTQVKQPSVGSVHSNLNRLTHLTGTARGQVLLLQSHCFPIRLLVRREGRCYFFSHIISRFACFLEDNKQTNTSIFSAFILFYHSFFLCF